MILIEWLKRIKPSRISQERDSDSNIQIHSNIRISVGAFVYPEWSWKVKRGCAIRVQKKQRLIDKSTSAPRNFFQ